MLEHIRQIMQSRFLTVTKTAAKLNMTTACLSRILHGYRKMTVQTFAQLCRVLEFDRETVLQLLREAADE